MSKPDIELYAWCDQAGRIDAFAAALYALSPPSKSCSIWIRSIDCPDETWRDEISLEDAIDAVRATFGAGTHVSASVGVILSSERFVSFCVDCYGEEYERRHPSGPLSVGPSEQRELHLSSVQVPLGSDVRSVEVEAAIAAMQVQLDLEDVLERVCVPEPHMHMETRGLVTTGAWAGVGGWGAPIETCATYHADAASIARDLALSWLHLHAGEKVERNAGMSLTELRTEVQAAPCGARIAVAGDARLVAAHVHQERAASAPREGRRAPAGGAPRGVRVAMEGDVALSREAVLEAIAAPPAMLLDALEAAAVPDEKWRAVLPRARESVEATKRGAPTREVDVTSRKHAQFIERHASFHVRRLPSGGVLLAAHPYRTLWPLWEDALYLLGITL